MSDPYSAPSFPDTSPSLPPSRGTRFLHGFVRYLAAASLLQLGFFALIRAALFFQIQVLEIFLILVIVSPVLSLVLASLFFRRFTLLSWAFLTILASTAAGSYLWIRLGHAYWGWEFYSSRMQWRLQYVDLNADGTLPAYFTSYIPTDTSVLDMVRLPSPSEPPKAQILTFREAKRNLSRNWGINCAMNVEEAIRFGSRLPRIDFGSEKEVGQVLCAGMVMELSLLENYSFAYLDSRRVLLQGATSGGKGGWLEEIHGDTSVFFHPETTITRIRHKRDSLRLWREDSARTASGK